MCTRAPPAPSVLQALNFVALWNANMPNLSTPPAPVHPGTSRLLRLEGAALLLAMAAVYGLTGESWGMAAALFLLPDLSLAAYLAGPRVGAVAYNAAHSTLGGLGLAIIGLLSGNATLVAGAAIWLGHVGFDRMLGYGLKYATGFRHTHLGMIGRNHTPTPPTAATGARP